jgi:hypothetical protein
MRFGNRDDFFRACRVAAIIVGVLLIGFCGFFYWGLDQPKADYTITPLSAFGRGLPLTATNYYYANSSIGFAGFLQLYRFDAPAADCIAYGKHLLEKTGGSVNAGLTVLTPPVNNPVSERNFKQMGLSEVKWFDIETIKSGFEGHRDASAESAQPGMAFWIDTERGRFYFQSSD